MSLKDKMVVCDMTTCYQDLSKLKLAGEMAGMEVSFECGELIAKNKVKHKLKGIPYPKNKYSLRSIMMYRNIPK